MIHVYTDKGNFAIEFLDTERASKVCISLDDLSEAQLKHFALLGLRQDIVDKKIHHRMNKADTRPEPQFVREYITLLKAEGRKQKADEQEQRNQANPRKPRTRKKAKSRAKASN